MDPFNGQDVCIRTTEMHTGGMPVRVIESGYPVPQGGTVIEKRADLKNNHDHWRKLIIYEPHGHFDMYAVVLVPPELPGADVGVIFLDNEGYSTMCGHATISVARYIVDRGLIKRPITTPKTEVVIQAPCGLVKAEVEVDRKEGMVKTGRVCFESVPAFVVQTDLEVDIPGHGTVKVDISYGGTFYVFVKAADVGIEVTGAHNAAMKTLAKTIKSIVNAKVTLTHPENPAYLYGVMFVDSRDTLGAGPAEGVVIFSDSETDRSPCGSGTTARTAILHHRGLMALGRSHVFRSGATGSEFIATPSQETEVGGIKAITVKVEGRGYYVGHNTITLEKDDVLGRGFLVR